MKGTLLVVSHPNVVAANQVVYVRLAELGWDVKLIVPNRWTDDYGTLVPSAVEGFSGAFARVRIALPGQIQRHFYLTRPGAWLERWRPRSVFIEQEPFSVPALQWGLACERAGIPWGVQADENLDRPFPWPARAIRRWTLSRIHYIAARSPAAGQTARRWGARGEIGVVPHTIPEWGPRERPPADPERFTVGYAGRLVEQKGIRDLLEAMRRLPFPSRLLVVGDGALRAELAAADLGQARLEVRTGVRTEGMRDLYAQMDVLVLPSRTTPTWAEQFGRVLCEALLCGTPVIGSSSGEIPWVIGTTGGGLVFGEGDATALAAAISRLREDPERRGELAARGREGVERHFAPSVAGRALDELVERGLARARRS